MRARAAHTHARTNGSRPIPIRAAARRQLRQRRFPAVPFVRPRPRGRRVTVVRRSTATTASMDSCCEANTPTKSLFLYLPDN
uniref:Uncharacterized protein n=1 Tax=Oryza punctata TaxID=4537 RepID=A0A0E0JJS4_ORYPU